MKIDVKKEFELIVNVIFDFSSLVMHRQKGDYFVILSLITDKI